MDDNSQHNDTPDLDNNELSINGAPMNFGERNLLMEQIEQLKADKASLTQEFANNENDENVKTIRDKLNTRAGDLIDGIINLALFDTSSSIRSKNSIWCAEVLLGIKAPAAADDDQFKKLLTELKGVNKAAMDTPDEHTEEFIREQMEKPETSE